MAVPTESSLTEQLEDHLQCQIHLGTLENPKSLPCQHAFCQTCLDDWIAKKNGQLICPFCQTNHGSFPDGAQSLPNSYQLLPILDVINKKAEKNQPVNEQSCIIENHKIVAFCSTCSRSVCQSCMYQLHKSHFLQNINIIKQELSYKKKTMQTAIQRACAAHGQLNENSVIAKDRLAVFRAECIDRVNAMCDKAVDEINTVHDRKSLMLKKQISDFQELYDRYKEAEGIVSTLTTKVPAALQENPVEMWEKVIVMKSLSNTTTGIENPYLQFEANNPSDVQLKEAGKLIVKTSPDASLSSIKVTRGSESPDANVSIQVNLQDSQMQTVPHHNEDIIVRVTQPNMSEAKIQKAENTYFFIPTMIGDYKIHAHLYGRDLCNSPYDLRISPKFNQKAVKFGDVKYKGAHDLTEFNNEIYVTDKGNNRIVVTGRDGKIRRHFTFKFKDMEHPFESFGITVSAIGILYITDMLNHEVIMSDINGKLLKRFGKSKLKKPTGIALTDSDVLVVDYDQHCVCIFNNEGEFKRSFGCKGKENGQFLHPWFIDVQSNGKFIITDCDNFRFQISDPINDNTKSVPVSVYDRGAFVRGVTVDSNDNIIVSVQANTFGRYFHVLMFNSGGIFLGRFSQENILLRPRGMLITKISTGKRVLLVSDETFGVAQFAFI